MKMFYFIVFYALIFTSLPVKAQITTSTDENQSYYEQCVAASAPTQKAKTTEMSCTCLSAHMESAEKIHASQQKRTELYSMFDVPEAPSKISQKRVFLDVYAPCLYIPVYDMVYDQCYYNKEYHPYFKDVKYLRSMCDCMASQSENYFRDYAKPRLAAMMQEGQKIQDPLQSLLDDVDYRKTFTTIRQGCFKAFAQ